MATQAQRSAGARRRQKPAINPAPSTEIPDKLTMRRPARVRFSREETRARIEAFTKEREEAFIAAVREDKD